MAKVKVKQDEILSTDPLITSMESVDLGHLPPVCFSYRDLNKRMSSRPRSFCPAVTTDDELIQGVKPLSDQIRSFRNGGLGLGARPLGDSNYDEDDSQVVDPSSEFGLDRFEKSEEVASQISTRMKKKYDEKLKQAEA